MFTGIITDVGSVIELHKTGDWHARIATAFNIDTIDVGASIACDGVCLTVTGVGREPEPWFSVDISAETVSRTNISRNSWGVGRKVNLERSLKVGDELGGHIVSGHVDGVATIASLRDEGESTRITFDAPDELVRFIAPKGSVALNGTSLTVNEVDGSTFGVNLIPHTKDVTTWGLVSEGDPINLEIDTLARYVARLAEAS